MNKFEEYLSMAKISDFIHRKELEEEKKKTVCLVFAIIEALQQSQQLLSASTSIYPARMM